MAAPDKSEASPCPLFTTPICYCLATICHRNNLSYTLSFHFVITTLPPLPPENLVTDSPHIARTRKQSRQSPTNERSENPLLSQLNSPTLSGPVVIHQSMDRCSVRESPTRPRSSPLWLDPQASPVGASRLPLHPAQFTAHFRSSNSVTLHITFPQTC